MLKKTIEYEDYNGVTRTEDFYFNLSESELVEMEMSIDGGFAEFIDKIVNAQDQPALVKLFKDFLLRCYGEKSQDGKYFHKSKELSERFACTPAYNKMYMEMATNATAAKDFINAVIPAKIRQHTEPTPTVKSGDDIKPLPMTE